MINKNVFLQKINSWGLSDQKIFASFQSFTVYFVGFTVIATILGVNFENKLLLSVWALMWFVLGIKFIILKKEKLK